MEKGKFIVIEGLDGCGKTTHTQLLKKSLEAYGKRVVCQAEPTDMRFGKMCRDVLKGKKFLTVSQLALLFTLDRIDHNKDKENGIDVLLEKGFTVISDRYYYSTLAYQGADMNMDWLKEINLGTPDIRRPDLCIFMDLDASISMDRIKSRGADTEIYENIEYLKRIRKRFKTVLSSIDDNIVTVDFSGDVEDVAKKILNAALDIYKS